MSRLCSLALFVGAAAAAAVVDNDWTRRSEARLRQDEPIQFEFNSAKEEKNESRNQNKVGSFSSFLSVRLVSTETELPVAEEFSFCHPDVVFECGCSCVGGGDGGGRWCRAKEKSDGGLSFAVHRLDPDPGCDSGLAESCCAAEAVPSAGRWRAVRLGAPMSVLAVEAEFRNSSGAATREQIRIRVPDGDGRVGHSLVSEGGASVDLLVRGVHLVGHGLPDELGKTLLVEERTKRVFKAPDAMVNRLGEWDPTKVGWFREVPAESDDNASTYAAPAAADMRRQLSFSPPACGSGEEFRVTFSAMDARRAAALLTPLEGSPLTLTEHPGSKVWTARPRHGGPASYADVTIRSSVPLRPARMPGPADLSGLELSSLRLLRGPLGATVLAGTAGGVSSPVDLRVEVFNGRFRCKQRLSCL